MRYLSRNQAEQWRLSKSYRLVPDKHTLFGKKYSLLELKEYAHDVNPRSFA